MGCFESPEYADGTNKVAEAIAKSKGFSVVGGGETLTLIDDLGIFDKFDHVSTGGGAMLTFLAGDELPGLVALEKSI